PANNRDLLASLAFGQEERPRRPPSRPIARPPKEEVPMEDETKPAPLMPVWVIAVAAGALILLGILAGLIVLRRTGVIGAYSLPACHYNNNGMLDETMYSETGATAPGAVCASPTLSAPRALGRPHALRSARNAPRRPGNGVRADSDGTT